MTATPTAEHDVTQQTAPSRIPRWRWIVPIVTFVCGCLAGAGLTFKILDDQKLGMMKRPGPDPERIIAELKTELDLDPQQAETVAQLVRKHDARMQELHRDMRPRFDENSRLFEEQISSVLDDRQKEIWRARVERMKKMFPPPPETGKRELKP